MEISTGLRVVVESGLFEAMSVVEQPMGSDHWYLRLYREGEVQGEPEDLGSLSLVQASEIAAVNLKRAMGLDV